MKKLTTILCGVVLTSTANAEPNGELALILSGYESIPSDEALLEGRSRAELEAALIALSADAGHRVFVRARATALLGHFPSDATRARLEALLDAGSEHPSILLAAVRTSARYGATLAVHLHPYLAHPDVHLREAAVVSLAQAGDRAALEAQLVEESNPLIRTRLIEALSAR